MWPGSPKDSTFASEEPECSRARRVTQSDPCGLEPHQDPAALDRAFPLPFPLNISHVRLIYPLIEMPVFMILVVNTHARVISWAGVCAAIVWLQWYSGGAPQRMVSKPG